MKNSTDTEHHIVTIWELDNVPSYELLFKFAQGFVHSAISILKEQVLDSQRDYFNIMPAHFALEHSIELFLKAAILLGDTSISIQTLSSKKFGHSLEDLYKKYRQIYPDEHLEIYHRIDDILDWRATINDPYGLEARYPFDNGGTMYGSRNRMVDLEFEIEICQEFFEDMNRLEIEIKKMAGIQSYTTEQFKYRITKQ